MTYRRGTLGLQAIAGAQWAIQPEWLATLQDICARESFDLEALQKELGRPLANTREVRVRDGVAVVPITGPLFRRANMFTEISGATSFDVLALDLQRALADPAVTGILLELDSPGGEVNGTLELAEQIRAAGRQKPVIAAVGYLAASAAYWLASAAGHIWLSPAASVGSIGVVGGYLEEPAERERADGRLELRLVSSQSPDKRPNPRDPKGRAVLQSRVDKLAAVFVAAVALGRGVTAEHVLEHFGKGGMLIGQEAISAGMADRLGTLEDALAEFPSEPIAARSQPKRGKRMEITTAAGLKAAYPELAAAMVAEAVAAATKGHEDALAAARTEGQAEGRKAGATAERERIQAIEALAMPGLEAVTAELIAEGVDAGTAAQRIIAAEKKQRGGELESRRQARQANPAVAATPSGEREDDPKGEDQAADPIEAEWKASDKARAEFASLDHFRAWRKANPRSAL